MKNDLKSTNLSAKFGFCHYLIIFLIILELLSLGGAIGEYTDLMQKTAVSPMLVTFVALTAVLCVLGIRLVIALCRRELTIIKWLNIYYISYIVVGIIECTAIIAIFDNLNSQFASLGVVFARTIILYICAYNYYYKRLPTTNEELAKFSNDRSDSDVYIDAAENPIDGQISLLHEEEIQADPLDSPNSRADVPLVFDVCPNCKKPITSKNNFCPYCGKRLKEDTNASGNKTPIAYHNKTVPKSTEKQSCVRAALKNKKVRIGLIAAAVVILFAAVFFIGLGIGESRGYHYNEAADGTPVPDNATVYVTRSGTKYHVLQICPSIKNKNIKSMSLADAVRKGYDPCKICSTQDGDSD